MTKFTSAKGKTSQKNQLWHDGMMPNKLLQFLSKVWRRGYRQRHIKDYDGIPFTTYIYVIPSVPQYLVVMNKLSSNRFT